MNRDSCPWWSGVGGRRGLWEWRCWVAGVLFSEQRAQIGPDLGLGTIVYMNADAWLVQFSSVAQLCLTLCDHTDRNTPGFPVHHQLLELTQAHVHRVGDAIQPSHPLSSPSLPTFNLSQHQGLFQRVSSSRQVAKVLEFQLQHQSFQ